MGNRRGQQAPRKALDPCDYCTCPMCETPKSPKSKSEMGAARFFFRKLPRPGQYDSCGLRARSESAFRFALHSLCQGAISPPSSCAAWLVLLILPIPEGVCLVLTPQVHVLRVTLWRSLSSEGVRWDVVCRRGVCCAKFMLCCALREVATRSH